MHRHPSATYWNFSERVKIAYKRLLLNKLPNFTALPCFQLLLPTELRDEAELVLPPNCILQSAPSSRVHWKDFDIDAFLEKGQLKPDENPYETYQINRTISDTILYYRQLPDPREKL